MTNQEIHEFMNRIEEPAILIRLTRAGDGESVQSYHRNCRGLSDVVGLLEMSKMDLFTVSITRAYRGQRPPTLEPVS